jgi:hypothetical protein
MKDKIIRMQKRATSQCPRCCDTMTLNSDFNGSYYLWEQYDFRLDMQKELEEREQNTWINL